MAEIPSTESVKLKVPVFRWLVAFAGILAAGAIAYALPSLGARLALPLVPSGIAVAVNYRWGRRMWPAVFAAGVATDLWAHRSLVTGIGVGIGLAGGSALAAWLLERGGFNASFSRAKDVPLFIFAAAVGMTLGATFGMLGFYVADPTSGALDPIGWIRWWSNTTAGVILVGPMLVAVSRQSLARFTEHWAEGGLWLLGVTICCGMIVLAPAAVGRPLAVLIAIFLVVVSAIRFGLVVATSGALAMSMATAFSFAFSHGIFADMEEIPGLVMLWSFGAALAGLSLIITALLAERDSAGLEKLRAEHRYAQIFDGGPQPVWVHDRDSLRFLLVNEAAVRQYGWSREEFLASRVAMLAAPGEPRVVPESGDIRVTGGTDGGGSNASEPFETRHRIQDGRVIEVEVWTRSIDFGGQSAELVFALNVTERRAFGQALIDAIAGEQRRIGQEIHDGLGQELTGLALSARALANRAERERDAIAGDLDQLAALATNCIQDSRRIVQGLSPLTDADGNLEAALEALAVRSSLSGTPVRFRARQEGLLIFESKVRNHLYRIAQEAVQNALKHSGASAIEIELWTRPDKVRLAINDDGQGLPTESTLGTGLGMRTMRFRASSIGAKLLIGHRDGGGNSVVCEVPQAARRAATA
jgi:PAS domain S-box-containing protein